MNIIIPLVGVALMGIGYVTTTIAGDIRCDSGLEVAGFLLIVAGIIIILIGIIVGIFFPDLVPVVERLSTQNVTVVVNL